MVFKSVNHIATLPHIYIVTKILIGGKLILPVPGFSLRTGEFCCPYLNNSDSLFKNTSKMAHDQFKKTISEISFSPDIIILLCGL